MVINEKVFRFGLVGIVGFLVDAGCLLVLVRVLDVAPLFGRVASFAIAATATYFLNQSFTFRLRDRWSLLRWASYLAATAVGACINLGVYRGWVIINGTNSRQLVIGTALGSVAAMLVNYFVSNNFVFRSTTRLRTANETPVA